MNWNLKRLSEDDYILWENLMEHVPDPEETYTATGRWAMIARPDFIKLNGPVRVNGYIGRIIDIAESEHSLMVRVESAKCARRFQKPDWLDYAAAPDAWAPATLQDLLEDAEHERRSAAKSIDAIEHYVARVMAEIAT